VFLKNSRTVIVTLLVLLFAGQSIASAAVVNGFNLNNTSMLTTPMAGSQPSCRNMHGSHSDADIAMRDMTDQSSTHCCDVDCRCPSGHCTSVTLPIDVITSHSTVVSPKNFIEFQWIIGQFMSFHYRPPIVHCA